MKMSLLLACLAMTTWTMVFGNVVDGGEGKTILVFGGNGFVGGSTAELLMERGNNVIMVNRGNWYWDSKNRILPHVKHIKCDRDLKLEDCTELIEVIKGTDQFDAVIDFSAFGMNPVKESTAALADKCKIYILFSSDTVYDFCEKVSTGPTLETDAVRHQDADEVERRRHYHIRGFNKMEAEEALMQQRVDGGFPFVILRLPDILGPRDTTFRFWLYQLWIKLSKVIKDKPVLIPEFLDNYKMSFIYSEDIPKAVVKILNMGPQINDQAINLAYPEAHTLMELIRDIQEALGVTEDSFQVQERNTSDHAYYYPTARRGPISVEKAENLLSWQPTPWDEMIKTTVEFYEDAMVNEVFKHQRDEIIQIMGHQAFKDDLHELYNALEELYKIELNHFKIVKDEL